MPEHISGSVAYSLGVERVVCAGQHDNSLGCAAVVRQGGHLSAG